MQRQTFINEMEARGYETTTLPNGNVKAKKRGRGSTARTTRELQCPYQHTNRERPHR